MSCQNCNASCNQQNGCTGACNSNQSFCSRSYQTVSDLNGDFTKWKEIEVDGLFLTVNEWNSLIEYIYNAYNTGTQCNACEDTTLNKEAFCKYAEDLNSQNKKDIRAGELYNHQHMTANMYNGALAKMQYLSSGNRTLSNNDKVIADKTIITANIFNKLKEYANDKFEFSKTQCDNCNTGCDVQCNTCNICNAGKQAEHCADDEGDSSTT